MLTPKEIYTLVYNATTDKVKEYRTDFEIDRKLIEKIGNFPFIHIARDMGTHLNYMLPADHAEWPDKWESRPFLFGRLRRFQILESLTGGVEYFTLKENDHLYHYFTGTELVEVTREEAQEIWTAYAEGVKEAWKKEKNNENI